MIFAKDLLLKGGAGLALCVAAGVGGVKLYGKMTTETLKSLADKVGLNCTGTLGNDGLECSIKTEGGLSAKQESNKQTGKKKSTSQTSSAGKIKVYREERGYENGFKFVIEDGDIELANGTDGTTISKLEQFETYEIKKDDGDKKLYLTRKNDANTMKEKLLGLPDGCKLPSTSSSTCSDVDLDADKLKLINFEGKGNNESLTVQENSNLKITISKETDSVTEFPNGGYKFVFKTEKNVTVNGSDGTKNIVIKKGADLEFKIKKSGNNLTLEKAWNAKSLGAKVGLECNEHTSDTKECTLKESGINVHNGGNEKHSGLTKGDNNGNKKVKYELDVEDHNQGIKFYTDETDGITLKNGSDADKKIEKKESNGSPTYEIKKTDSTWYLTKKTTTGGSS